MIKNKYYIGQPVYHVWTKYNAESHTIELIAHFTHVVIIKADDSYSPKSILYYVYEESYAFPEEELSLTRDEAIANYKERERTRKLIEIANCQEKISVLLHELKDEAENNGSG